jgi:hypothetical protein
MRAERNSIDEIVGGLKFHSLHVDRKIRSGRR